jgi:hypothetical protein
LSAVAIAVAALVLAFAFTAFAWRDVAGIAALGAIAAPIAAVVGAYFGVQVSATAAREATERAARAEEDRARALADVATVLSHLSSEQGPRVRATLNFR